MRRTAGAAMAQVAGVHEAVAALIGSGDERISAAACELVYIGTFSNEVNHHFFTAAGAVAGCVENGPR